MALSDPRPRNPRTVLNNPGGPYPPCFNSSDEYYQWVYLLRLSGENMRVGFCFDCTPTYKMEMMRNDRCTHPETQFLVLRDKKDLEQVALVGVSSASVYWAKVERGAAVINEGGHGQDK